MPSTFLRIAVDFDGDGKRDLVDNVPDALASTANPSYQFFHWEPPHTLILIRLYEEYPAHRPSEDRLHSDADVTRRTFPFL